MDLRDQDSLCFGGGGWMVIIRRGAEMREERRGRVCVESHGEGRGIGKVRRARSG